MSCLTNLLAMSFLVWISELYFDLEKGILKRMILVFILLLELTVTDYFQVVWLGWLLALITLGFYLLCYTLDKRNQLLFYLGGITLILVACCLLTGLFDAHDFRFLILMSGFSYGYLLYLRNHKFSFLMLGLFASTVLCYYLSSLYPIAIALATMLILFIGMIEWEFSKNASRYEKQSNKFQNEVMLHHYEEVQNVYLNMRGWRHDYHNHIQAIRAYLSFNQIDEATKYLQELESDLDQVDTLVKSGHLMIDAILNSKLSMALTADIQINCKATVPDKLNLSDVDICVLLGNLLDNAIEACMKVNKEDRFIRIYIDTLKHQLYISITNSASESLTLNERQYISEKRGNHGHGMKRVKLCVDKYHGYLNLKNEVGVFASEVMIPLDHSCTN